MNAPALDALEGIRTVALAVGFDGSKEYLGYDVHVFTAFILLDEHFVKEYDTNWNRELAECPGELSHPDDLILATVKSFSELEKAAIRRRVHAAFVKWANV